MNIPKISLRTLTFAFFCFLVLTAVGTSAHAGSISGTIYDGLGVYTSGNIKISAFTDQAGTNQVAGPATITSLGAYNLPVGDVYDGVQLWVKARWDADASGTKNGGDGAAFGAEADAVQHLDVPIAGTQIAYFQIGHYAASPR